MNKSEHRHQLIRALVAKNKIHTQAELQALLAENDIQVTQATLSRDIKTMNLSKVREADHSYYVLNTGSISKWEKHLENYMEDGLVMLRPVQHQVVLKTLPGLAQSFGAVLDALDFKQIIATVCGDDVCLLICEMLKKHRLALKFLKNLRHLFSSMTKKSPVMNPITGFCFITV